MGFFSRLSIEIIDAYEKGMSIDDIAMRLETSREEVKYIVESYQDNTYDEKYNGGWVI